MKQHAKKDNGVRCRYSSYTRHIEVAKYYDPEFPAETGWNAEKLHSPEEGPNAHFHGESKYVYQA